MRFAVGLQEAAGLDVLTDGGDAKATLEKILSRRLPQFLYRW